MRWQDKSVQFEGGKILASKSEPQIANATQPARLCRFEFAADGAIRHLKCEKERANPPLSAFENPRERKSDTTRRESDIKHPARPDCATPTSYQTFCRADS